MNRRDLILQSLGLLALPLAAEAANRPPESLRFTLAETAGLRRFGYPVRITFHADLWRKAVGSLSLQRDGKPVRAQFREELTSVGKVTTLDFNTSPGPLETETYTIVSGGASVETKGGMNLEHKDGVFRVNSGSSLHYDVPEDLTFLLKSVGNSSKEYVGPPRTQWGLGLGHANGVQSGLGPAKGSILYQGPLACALRFVNQEKAQSGVDFDIRMHFPSSKSWVEVEVTLNDPKMQVRSIQLVLQLKLDGSPTLVDLGANDTVYGQIKGKEVMALSQEPDRPWKVEMGALPTLKSFAVSVPDAKSRAEGWAHVMDRQRCTAAAIADFGRYHADRIETHADGSLHLVRRFDNADVPSKSFRFWLHFVPMPVQVGAATSPQAMLSPLQAKVI